jgi:acetoin:2,6-dichlorophenolindophenol oxidoreductase subunit alpha
LGVTGEQLCRSGKRVHIGREACKELAGSGALHNKFSRRRTRSTPQNGCAREVSLSATSNQAARVLDMLRTMHVIREFEEAAAQAWRDGHVRGSVHQYVGQEAIAVGVCANLRPTDYVSSNHRGHGHSIAKGADPIGMMKELFGRADGTCGGKAGSMHIADFSIGMLGANGVVADGATIAVGAAQSIKILKQDRVSVPFFGDGAINRGPLMEAFNWAKIYRLPVLFVCEHNGYAATTRTADVTAGEGFVARAKSFGIHGEAVDGNDLLAVDAAAERLVARIRGGDGPAFLYATTYRHYGHFAHDKGLYRDPAEIKQWLERDPILRCQAWLGTQGIGADELATVASDAKALIARGVKEANESPWPLAAAAFADVQDVGAPR